MSRLDEIQARVDAATPQPWTVTYYAAHDEPCDRHDGAAHVSYVTGPEDAWVLWPGYVGDDAIVAVMPADLALIAAAPDDVRWLLARVRELEAGLAHAESVAAEIRTIAEHDRSSGVDDGRDVVLTAAQRLREIVDLVEREILSGPSPFRAALAGDS